MRILDTNNKFILIFSNPSKLSLIDAITLQTLHTKEQPLKTDIKAASLQYSTGIAAICIGSKVHFYDFFYQRQIDSLDTYKLILKVFLRKNLLIIVSQDRILVYNVEKNENESYIPTLNGKMVFFDENYTRLSIFYPEDHSVITSKPVWSRKGWKCTNGVKYENGCYYDEGQKVVLTLFNTLSFYKDGQMIKIYGFDGKIVDIRSTEKPKLVLVLLENNEILGQNLTEQFRYMFQEVKQNGLSYIEQNEPQRKDKVYSYFWISNGYIYHWKKQQNKKGKLLRANINEPIKNVYVQVSAKQESDPQEKRESPSQSQANQ